MNQIMKVFESNEFGSVRVIQENGVLLFCGIDVAKALGYSNPWDALRRHCKTDGLVKREGVSTTTNQHGKTTVQTNLMVYVTEGNVYRLIAHSKLPSAERFESWMFDEVIPSIRKHGAYMTDSLLEQVVEKPEVIFELARRLLAEQEEHKAVRKKLDAAQPKADYYDAFVNDEDCTCIRYSGKVFNIPQNTFVQILLDHKYLYRDAKRRLMPFSDKQEKGYFIVRDCYAKNGKLIQQTLLTCKGKAHIRSQLKKWGDLV